MKNGLRLALGVLFWASLVGAAWYHLKSNDDAAATTTRLMDHIKNSPEVFDSTFPASAPLAEGNPVRIRTKDGFFAAGRVESVMKTADGQVARVAIFPEYTPFMGAQTRLVAARTAGDIAWVVKTLLPDDTQEEIRQIITSRWRQERDQLFQDLRPGITRLLEDTLTIIQEELPGITESHQREFDIIGRVLKEKGWDAHVEEVFTAVLWPQVSARSAPLLDSIGDEIVGEFPVWSMSWAYLSESLPFSDKGQFEKKVRDFIKEKAVPIIKKRQTELKTLAKGTVKELMRDERAVEALQSAANDVTRDPRFRSAASSILRALFVDNPRMKDLTQSVLTRQDLRQPVDKFIESFEPAIRRVANRLLMNKQRDGINPDLARVLRRKLLREDEDWVLLDLVGGNEGDVPSTLPGFDGGRQ